MSRSADCYPESFISVEECLFRCIFGGGNGNSSTSGCSNLVLVVYDIRELIRGKDPINFCYISKTWNDKADAIAKLA
ncbi:hypothetical protein Sjap_009886 [Stephania japonica]|uniref:Uncharacterized protein n=1 Tax=Stephania japonica TaxID=461633 RepID=A0AAP0P444_9MAGN